MNKKNYLYEILSFKPTQILMEDAASGEKRMIVEGVFQRKDIKNANGRVYPGSIWEKIFKNENIQKMIQERRMFGEVDHPQDGKNLLARASHIVLDQKMNETTGDIIGKAEILNTPSGKILQELFNAGCTVGISSRGSGSVKKTDLGEVVQDDFILESYDFVSNPSTFGAFPKVVSEDIDEESNNIKENSMTATDKFGLLEQRARKLLSLDAKVSLNESVRAVAEPAAKDLIIEFTKLEAEHPEVKALSTPMIEDLAKIIRSLRQPVAEEFPFEKKDGKEKKDDKEDDKEKKEKKEEAKVAEETTGSAETGWVRTVPKEALPGKGEGWPINPADAGVLAGINNGVDEFMNGAKPVVEDEELEEEEEFFEAEKESEKGNEDEEEEEEGDDDEETEVDIKGSHDKVTVKETMDSRTEALIRVASTLVSQPTTNENSVAKAFAAVYLMERSKRKNESAALSSIITALQSKFKEAVEEGKFVVETITDEDLAEKYDVALGVIEQLRNRHQLLAAKVYAAEAMEKAGLKGNVAATKKVNEAIRTAPTKANIDEVILALVPVKGMKVPSTTTEKLKEEASQPPSKTLEGAVAKLEETAPKTTEKKKTILEGAAFGERLAGGMTYSRSTSTK